MFAVAVLDGGPGKEEARYMVGKVGGMKVKVVVDRSARLMVDTKWW